MAEGRRMMRIAGELEPERFDALIEAYQRVLTGLFEELGGQNVDASGDTVTATFAIPTEAASAAVAAHRAVAALDWPDWPRPGVSVGLASDEAGCSDLCDAAERGQTFLSPEIAPLLGGEDLGELEVRDLGEQLTRRTSRPVRAYQLVDRVLAEFEPAWAVVVRDWSPVEGDDADSVDVLRVFWSEDEARAEVERLRERDPSPDRLYYCEATAVQRR
jgi:class 3 adenylate cyclase